VEAAVDSDWIDGRAFDFDYWRADSRRCRWTHRGVACCALRFWSVLSNRMEDYSVAGGTCLYDLRVRIDLLPGARLPRTGMAVVNAWSGDRCCTLVARVARLSRLPSLLQLV